MRNDTSTMQMNRMASWPGRPVLARDGPQIGKVKDIYQDIQTGQPEWLAVSTGWFNGRTSFVPLEKATERDDSIMVPYDQEIVKDAPTADSEGKLSEREEEALYRHYGRSFAAAGQPGRTTGTGGGAMTRSEEEPEVRTTTREAGRVR